MTKKKVYVCDNPNLKTTKHWVNWLKENYEVVVDMYFNPVYAEWADVIYIEWCEPPAIQASQLKGFFENVYDHEGVRGEREKTYTGDFDWTGKPIFVRGIDMDIFYGHYRSVNWANITGFIYIAEHLKELMRPFPFPDSLRIAHIPLSVNLGDWNFRERSGDGRKVAWINHNWSAKGLPLMLQAFEKLVRLTPGEPWEFWVISNGRSTEHWLHDGYIPHMVKTLGLQDRVKFFNDGVPNIDEFLEDKDYLVSSSYKEAFSLILAEAMAKGIKAVTHSWWGVDKIWPDEMIWKTVDEFPAKLLGFDPSAATHPVKYPYDSKHYRELAGRYSHEVEIQKLREFTGL